MCLETDIGLLRPEPGREGLFALQTDVRRPLKVEARCIPETGTALAWIFHKQSHRTFCRVLRPGARSTEGIFCTVRTILGPLSREQEASIAANARTSPSQ